MGHLKNILKKFIGIDTGFSYNFYKNGEYELIKKASKLKFNTLFDVGAHHGEWSLIANKFFPDSKIHTFEISETNYKKSLDNLTQKNFIINNFGFSNKQGNIEYKDYGFDSQGNTTILESDYNDNNVNYDLKKTTVKIGDDYCKEKNINHIDFLKIDTEGSEHLVLEGFKDILQKGNVRLIQFEYGYANGDAKFLMKDFFHFFKKYNYIVAKLRKEIKLEKWNYSFNDFKSGPKYIAKKKSDDEIKSLLEN